MENENTKWMAFCFTTCSWFVPARVSSELQLLFLFQMTTWCAVSFSVLPFSAYIKGQTSFPWKQLKRQADSWPAWSWAMWEERDRFLWFSSSWEPDILGLWREFAVSWSRSEPWTLVNVLTTMMGMHVLSAWDLLLCFSLCCLLAALPGLDGSQGRPSGACRLGDSLDRNSILAELHSFYNSQSRAKSLVHTVTLDHSSYSLKIGKASKPCWREAMLFSVRMLSVSWSATAARTLTLLRILPFFVFFAVLSSLPPIQIKNDNVFQCELL